MEQKKKIPIRTCTGCRQAKEKKDLIRIVRNKEGEVFADATGKQNGRGAYICPNKDCFEKAIRNKGLVRTLKIKELDEELINQLLKQIGENCG